MVAMQGAGDECLTMSVVVVWCDENGVEKRGCKGEKKKFGSTEA